ncbi:MAG: zf-HC2 domain-containing protein [Deltaproteobacteria bacterium]|nr:zf-HC2 domain-containing protein [Deltaproteobacteria bacterium]
MTPRLRKVECRDIRPLIDSLLDGELDDGRASAVRGHVRTCAECASVLDTARALLDAARCLPDVEPPPSLWKRIDWRLSGEEVADSQRSRWWWWWQAIRRPVVTGGACVAGVVLAAALLLMPRIRVGDRAQVPIVLASILPAPPSAAVSRVSVDPMESALRELARSEERYRKAIADLRALSQGERRRWQPAVTRAFDENLATIDAAVARQREVFQKQPGDVAALDALHASYRKEIDFLQEALVRGEVAP